METGLQGVPGARHPNNTAGEGQGRSQNPGRPPRWLPPLSPTACHDRGSPGADQAGASCWLDPRLPLGGEPLQNQSQSQARSTGDMAMEGPELRSGAPRMGLWGHRHTPTGRHSHTHTGTPVMQTPQRPRSEAATVTSGHSAARAEEHRLDGMVSAAACNHRAGDLSQSHPRGLVSGRPCG